MTSHTEGKGNIIHSQSALPRESSEAQGTPMRLPDSIPSNALREVEFSAGKLNAHVRLAEQCSEQANSQQSLFDQCFERKVQAMALMEELREELRKVTLNIHNVEVDCQNIFKIKGEKEANVKSSRLEASCMIWSQVTALHTALASSRGSLLAGEVIKALTEFLRSQNSAALVHTIQHLPTTADEFLSFIETKPLLAQSIKHAIEGLPSPKMLQATQKVTSIPTPLPKQLSGAGLLPADLFEESGDGVKKQAASNVTAPTYQHHASIEPAQKAKERLRSPERTATNLLKAQASKQAAPADACDNQTVALPKSAESLPASRDIATEQQGQGTKARGGDAGVNISEQTASGKGSRQKQRKPYRQEKAKAIAEGSKQEPDIGKAQTPRASSSSMNAEEIGTDGDGKRF